MKLKIFAPLILSAIIFLTGCGRQDSPESALNEIKIALAERDEIKLSARVDMDEFFSQTYDAATVELAKNYETFKEKYPDDPYFQRDAEFLTEYNAEQKERHLKFLDGVKDSFFDKIPAPEIPEDNPTAYVADEFQKICDATTATVKETIFDGDKATVVLDVRGDNSLRGMFVGQWTFKLAFHRDEKNIWHFDEITNLDELTPALVDKAEIVWVTFY